VKYIGLIFVALAINLGLFLLMDSMISRDRMLALNLIDTQAIEFVRTQLDEETRARDRRPPPPQKPQEMQRPRAEVENLANRVSSLTLDKTVFEVASLLGDSGGVAFGQSLLEGSVASMNITMADELIPLTMLPPLYPYAAQLQKTEGWVHLVFIVTAEGNVLDPVVTDSEPEEIFDQASIDAALRWRFRPVTSNGVAVSTLAQIRVNFYFELE